MNIPCSEYKKTDFEAVLRLPIGEYAGVIVVPVYDETPETVGRLLRSCDPRVLAILVVNRSISSPWFVKDSNNNLMKWLASQYWDSDSEAQFKLFRQADPRMPDALVVDRNQDDSLLTRGVGEARKIGCDIAANLINHGRITSPWIHGTDADTILPADLFLAADKVYTDQSAVCTRMVRSFSSDPHIQQLVDMYDLTIAMAMIAMEQAHAPWTVAVTGCGVAVSVGAYMQAGGVPAYELGEDHHLLNVACKLGIVHRIHGEPIRIEARPESRPPEGFSTTISDLNNGMIDGKKVVCGSAAQWDLVRAFYLSIERCLLEHETVPDACCKVCRQYKCEKFAPKVAEAIYAWVGPIDVMASCMSARSVYETTHLQLDLRKSRRVHRVLMDLVESVQVNDSWKVNTWAGAQHAKDVHEAADLAQQAMVHACGKPTGVVAWTDRLFPIS